MKPMPPKRYPYLSRETTRHKKTVWYFRRGKQRVRLPNEYGSVAFWEAYNTLLAGKPIKPQEALTSGSMAWLVARYKESGHFASLKPSTRRMRDNILKAILKDNGDVQFVRITKKHIQAGMDRRAETPHAANNFLKVLNGLFTWALANDHVTVNPCSGVEKRKDKIEGHHTWSLTEVQQYRDFYPVGTRQRLAMDLLLFTGLRRSDIVRIGRQHLKDGVLSIRTEKTGTWVHITVFRELSESIEKTPTGDLAFLTSSLGEPFKSAASFGNWFRKACNAARMNPECSAHGLRKAGATIAANNGASPHELMAMYGWKRLTEAETYTREADKVRLAKGAAERIANNAMSHPEPTAVAPIKENNNLG